LFCLYDQKKRQKAAKSAKISKNCQLFSKNKLLKKKKKEKRPDAQVMHMHHRERQASSNQPNCCANQSSSK
jgi:hypothetical protein